MVLMECYEIQQVNTIKDRKSSSVNIKYITNSLCPISFDTFYLIEYSDFITASSYYNVRFDPKFQKYV